MTLPVRSLAQKKSTKLESTPLQMAIRPNQKLPTLFFMFFFFTEVFSFVFCLIFLLTEDCPKFYFYRSRLGLKNKDPVV